MNTDLGRKMRVSPLIILIITTLSIVSCSTSLELFVNSAKYSDDVTYGYSIDNPICIRYKHVSSDLIIATYVKYMYAIHKTAKYSDTNILSIDCLEKCQVIKIVDIVKPKPNNKNELLRECTIKSDNQTIILYFDTNRSIRDLKVPKGLFFSRLTGKKQ